MINYFSILGLSINATTEEIHKAYRLLAKEHHPDRNPGNAESENKFKEIKFAYEFLCDETKKLNHIRDINKSIPKNNPVMKKFKAMTPEERMEFIAKNDPNMGKITHVQPPPFNDGRPKQKGHTFIDAYSKYYEKDDDQPLMR